MSGFSPEQVIEFKHSLDGLAELLSEYVSRLEQHGFTRQEALTIAIGWQRSVLQQPTGDS